MVRRITRKEIKQPDEFISTTAQVLSYVVSHTRTIVPAGVVILALIGGIVFYRYQAQSRDLKSQEMLFRAMRAYDRYLALSADKQEADSEEEKEEGQENQAREAMAEAEAGLQKIVDSYPNTDAAWQARFYLANIRYDVRDYLAAVDAYEKILERSWMKKNTNIRAIVLYNLGHLYETLGYMERALEYYRGVMELGSTLYTQVIGEDLRRIQWKSDVLQGRRQTGVPKVAAPEPPAAPGP